jgi:RNA recognition motif-containing protein
MVQGKEQGKERNKGYAFVTFLDRASAEEAISKTNGRKLDGRVVRLNKSKPRG